MEYDTIEFVSYADGTPPDTYVQSFDDLVGKLETDLTKVCKWFHHNDFKTNPGKFIFLLSPFVDGPKT